MKKQYFILLLILTTQITLAQCIKSVITGSGHSGYIDNNGTLWMWGYNNFGQLGNNSTTNSNTPIQIGEPGEWKILASIKNNQTYAIKADGTLWQWGSRLNLFGIAPGTDAHVPTQVGTANDWKFISAGQGHIMGIKTDGTLWGMGKNYYGSIGNNSLVDVDEPIQIGLENDWLTVATGGSFTAAIKTNGTLWAWGGWVAVMTMDKQKTPIQIGNDNNWKEIDAGNNFLVALKSNGTLWEWGMKGYSNGVGLDIVYNTLTQTNSDTDWKHIDASMYKFYAIKENGTIYYWGDGTADSPIPNNVTFPTRFGDGNNWDTVSAGQLHTIGIKKNGTVWTWGTNLLVIFGNDASEPSYEPIQIPIDCNSTSPVEPEPCKCECMFIQNPVNDFATIIADSDVLITDITLYDISGKSIFSNVENNSIYVGNLQQGIYITEIKCKGKSYYKKFIKL